jgi:hypothetical protein
MRATTDRDVFTGTDEEKKKKENEDEGDDEEEEGDEEDGDDGETGDAEGKEGMPSLSLPTVKKTTGDSAAAGSSNTSTTSGPKVVDMFGIGEVVSSLTQQPAQQNKDEGQLAGLFGEPNGVSSGLQLPDQAFSNIVALLKKEPPVGVLYDCKALQIGYKAQIENGYQCKMVLYYGNRMPAPLTEVVAQLPESEALKVQARPNEPFEVKGGVQIVHYFLWTCRKPFLEIPSLALKFKYNGIQHALVLKVPLLLTSFCLPAQISAQDCLSNWKAYGAEKECIAVRKLPGPADVTELKTVITTNAHMALVSDVENKAENFIASSSFQTGTKDANGNLVTIAILLRVETKAGMNVIRISIRSGHKQVSDAVLASVTTLFGATE